MHSQGYDNATFVNDNGKRSSDVVISKTDSTNIDLWKDDDSYDPFKHRKVEHPLSNTETLIHLLKGSLGTGILAMPQAIYHAGYIIGSIGTVAIGLLCVYNMQMLLQAHYELCKRKRVPSMDYPTITKNAVLEGPQWMHRFAPCVLHVTNSFLFTYQIGSCCIYVVFIASNIKSIYEYTTGSIVDIRLVMVIILLPIVLINWVRNLKYLAPFSSIANFITVISYGIIFYFLFRLPMSMEGKRAIGPINELPLFLGTVLFSLETVGIIMPLENEMRSPKSYIGFTGILSRGFAIICTLYIGMGLFGYLRYGADIKPTITLNLDIHNEVDEILAQSVKAMLALGIFITHGLACYVGIDLAWSKYIAKKVKNNRFKLLWEYVVRTVIVLLTFLLAVAIPKLDLFISFFGAFCLSILGVIFPAIIDSLVFMKQRTGCSKVIMIVKNTLIGMFGLCALVIGTSTSVMAIVDSFTDENIPLS